MSDFKALLSGQEAYFVDNGEYLESCENAACEVLPGFKLSPKIEITTESRNDGGDFLIRSKHPQGGICYTIYSYADNPDGVARGKIAKIKGECTS